MRKQRPLHGPGAGRPVEYPGRNLQPTVRIRTAQATAKNSAVRSLNRRVNADPKTEPRMPWVQQFSKLGSVGVLKLCCTTPSGRIRPSACAVQPNSIAHHPAPILVCRSQSILAPSCTRSCFRLMICSSLARNRSPSPVVFGFFGRIVSSDASTQSRSAIHGNPRYENCRLSASQPPKACNLKTIAARKIDPRSRAWRLLHGRPFTNSAWRA